MSAPPCPLWSAWQFRSAYIICHNHAKIITYEKSVAVTVGHQKSSAVFRGMAKVHFHGHFMQKYLTRVYIIWGPVP